MPKQTYIDIPGTKANAVAFSLIASIALNILNDYQQRYKSFGKYEGTDQFGKAFDESFVPPYTASLAALLAFALGMHYVGDSIFSTAHFLEKSNDINLGIAPQVHAVRG